jgi:NRAMP (natural resistance-associated macrophage protein)-like metal ion transporter
VSGFADNDAGGITTYSVAGVKYGYELLWVLLASQIVLFFTQEVGARLGLATGQGLTGLVRERFGVRWVTFLTITMLIANVGSIVAEFAGTAAALSLFNVAPASAQPSRRPSSSCSSPAAASARSSTCSLPLGSVFRSHISRPR